MADVLPDRPTVLDWSGSERGSPKARVAWKPEPCRHCGRGALLRHPATGDPCHKICEETAIDRAALVRFVCAMRAAIALTIGGTHA